MNKLLEAITKNPLFVFVGWLGTMIALILAIVVPYIQTRRVILNFSYTSNLLVSNSLSEMEGLDISFEGSKVEQLTVTTCEISNTGNVTIDDSDVYEGHKIRVFTGSEDAEVLFARVVSQSYDTNNCQVSYDRNGVDVHFDVLEKREKVVINIYHTGDSDTVFSIEGKIKEGKIRYEDISVSTSTIISTITSVISSVCSCFGIYFVLHEKRKLLTKKILILLICAVVLQTIAILGFLHP